MRSYTLLFFLFLPLLLCAQPGPKPENTFFKFGLYDAQGCVIDPLNKEYKITFLFDNEKALYKRGDYHDTTQGNVPVSSSRLQFKEGKYYVPVLAKPHNIAYHSSVTINIQHQKGNMMVHAEFEIDSVAFVPGEYFIPLEDYPLFHSIKTYYGSQITNFAIQYYVKGADQTGSYSYKEWDNRTVKNIECWKDANQLEQKHGGKNWARVACDTCQRMCLKIDVGLPSSTINTDKFRIRIYPFKHSAYIKHEFYGMDLHVFSISYDKGKSWKKLISTTGWYVNLIYFTDVDRIGIKGQDFLLVQHINNFSAWEYYRHDYQATSDEKHVALCLPAANYGDENFIQIVLMK